MEADEKKAQINAAGRNVGTRKPYTRPTLTREGDVESLTKALGPGAKDGLNGSNLL